MIKKADKPVDSKENLNKILPSIEELDLDSILSNTTLISPAGFEDRCFSFLDKLIDHESLLSDPDSEKKQQPDYARNRYRSIKPEYFVAVGVCTHLGCSPKYLPESLNQHIPSVKAGFFCPCHGSSFDMAGRVFSGGPAPLNLMVPRYHFISETKIVIGDD